MSADAQPPIEAQRQSGTGLAGLLGSVISAGKGILARRRQAAAEAPSGDLLAKCRQLLHHRGEASGLALACEVIADYQALDEANQTLFFDALGNAFDPDPAVIAAAADAYQAASGEAAASRRLGGRRGGCAAIGSRCIGRRGRGARDGGLLG